MQADRSTDADIFDPSGDGFAPCPVLDVAATARRAVIALDELRQALYGSMTPLNLREAARDLSQAQALIEPHARLLTDAANLIAANAPLAKVFRDDSGPWIERAADSTGHPTLSPKQIVALAAQAGDLLPSASMPYDRAVEELEDVVPPLISGLRRSAERDRLRLEADALVDGILLDMESRACDHCGAGPGEYCVSSGGKVTGPHAPRRHASPLAAEHKVAARYAQRSDWSAKHRAEPAEVVENRQMVGEVIEMISEQLTDLDR